MGIFSTFIFCTKKFKHLGKGINVGLGVSVINPQHIHIDDGFYADRWTRMHTWPEYRGKQTGYMPDLHIGKNVSFMTNCYVSCMNKIYIGNGCLFGDNVYITDNFHGDGSEKQKSIPPIDRELFSKGSVTIGNNVWVGRNVCILPGVTVGDSAIIGANAVVTRDVESCAVVAGVPAKRIN